MSEIDVRYILNQAYQVLKNNGVHPQVTWMKQLHTMTQRHDFAAPRVDQLTAERNLCLKTVRQLQDHIDVLRRTNKRYAQRIVETDTAINAAMENIDMWADMWADGPFDTEAIEEAHAILDRALCNFPVELLSEVPEEQGS